MLTLNLYRVTEVRSDYIVLADGSTKVKLIFAGGSAGSDLNPPTTKEEWAKTFKSRIGLQVGLKSPVLPMNEPRTIDIFMDIPCGGIPFPYRVSRIEVEHIRP